VHEITKADTLIELVSKFIYYMLKLSSLIHFYIASIFFYTCRVHYTSV